MAGTLSMNPVTREFGSLLRLVILLSNLFASPFSSLWNSSLGLSESARSAPEVKGLPDQQTR
jgi:hypothetical protein